MGLTKSKPGTQKRRRIKKENQKKTIRPEAEELKTMLFEMSFSEVARKFGVTDNTIRKWCKQYGIPSSAKDYKK